MNQNGQMTVRVMYSNHSHQSKKKKKSSGLLCIALLLPISKHLGKLNSTFHVFVAYFGYFAATLISSGYMFYLLTY